MLPTGATTPSFKAKLPWVTAGVALIGALALLPSTWGTAFGQTVPGTYTQVVTNPSQSTTPVTTPPASESQGPPLTVTTTSGTSVTVQQPAGTGAITVPPGLTNNGVPVTDSIVLAAVGINLGDASADLVQALSQGLVPDAPLFQFTMKDATTGQFLTGPFSPPLTITITSASQTQPNSAAFLNSSNTWTQITTGLSVTGSAGNWTITFTTNHLTLFGVFVNVGGPVTS